MLMGQFPLLREAELLSAMIPDTKLVFHGADS
jgi:hypothetical protein